MSNSKRKSVKTIVAVLFLIIAMMVFVSCDKVTQTEDVKVQDTAFSMGTAITSTLYGSNSDILEQNLASVRECLSKVDQEISWRNEGSLTDIFNKEHSVSVGNREEVFRQALDVAKESGGAFDPTVLSVSELWDIGGENERHPSDEEIQKALEKVDYTVISLNEDVLSCENPDVLFELGAIGKGYALKEAYEAIDKSQVSSGVISAGSSILTFGTKPDGSKFRVGLRNPRGDQDDLIGIFELTDLSVSTSGDYEKYFEEDGKRYHHILDARTGYPADSGLTSVTVVADGEEGNGTMCDALSTALFVMGEDKALDFWRSGVYDFDLVLVTADGRVVVTEGLAGRFTESEGSGYTYETAS